MELTDLIKLCSSQEQTSLKILANSVAQNMRDYNSNPTTANLRDWQSSKDALAAEQAALEKKYAQRRSLSWMEYRETDNKAEVLRQLEALGYEITQRTFYRHCKQGKCRTNGEGVFSRRMVKAYVQEAGFLRAGETFEDDDGQDSALSIQKQQKEIAKLDWHNKTAKLEYQKKAGMLIEREGVYLEIAARTVALDSSFVARVIEEDSPKLIAAVGGDQNKLPEFQDLLREAWDDLLNSFCTTDTFEVLFEDEEEFDVDELLSDDVGNEE